MKKLIVLSVVAMFSILSLRAQFYVGGSVGYAQIKNPIRYLKDNSDIQPNCSLQILPEFGYHLSERFDVALILGYTYNRKSESFSTGGIEGTQIAEYKDKLFTVQPYLRWTFLRFGRVSIFADIVGEFSVGNVNEMRWNSSTKRPSDYDKVDTEWAWSILVKPGVLVECTDNVGIMAHIGVLGYKDRSRIDGSTGIAAQLSAQDLTIGVIFNL